jgi:2-keto-4-pentenoate hydratase/2-oxohepta-3-ene-1,7-dioic acid hydratase in catechol pathway
MLGKTPDDFAPLGPWLVTADQIPNPNNLDLWCDVNGERRQSSNTADMVFNCAQLVSYCSQHMTLEPATSSTRVRPRASSRACRRASARGSSREIA